ncbi:MAG: 50S ribosomal protein L22 [Chloroflexi bacterium]|nr:50S ribosomal protein L22 [Anaerolineae bacterium]RLC74206.1 MAG: 50S ribosomal protein L22 [Chloroflexota bacterium]
MASEVRAVARYVRMSPQKVRLVADQVRGMGAVDALAVLKHMPQAAARPMYKVIRSAVANAEENIGMDREDLYIAQVTVDGGPMMKRWRAGARGRYKKILKRSSHITVVLSEVEE